MMAQATERPSIQVHLNLQTLQDKNKKGNKIVQGAGDDKRVREEEGQRDLARIRRKSASDQPTCDLKG